MSGLPDIGTLGASVSKDGAVSCFETHRSGAAMLLGMRPRETLQDRDAVSAPSLPLKLISFRLAAL